MADITNPKDIPKDVREKILAAAEALIDKDIDEAYHQLYSIADPSFSEYHPWAALNHDIGHPLFII